MRVWSLLALLAVAGCSGAARGADATAAPPPDPATTAAVLGRVHDASSGAALGLATVAVSDAAGELAGTATTDGGGRFRLDGLAPGRYRIGVYYADLAPQGPTVQLAAGQQLELEIAVDTGGPEAAPSARGPAAAPRGGASAPAAALAPRRGTILGVVSDRATGEPLEGAVVTATAPELRDALMAISDADGAYRLLAVPPGLYTISVYYQLIDYGAIEYRRPGIEVAPGARLDIPMALDTEARGRP